ncbi:MAG: type II toxin-antitoxin system VapC family toxin [Candidatus Diapherotrites archaeon]|nr:type II toxin-antitoxin system VapC family toxin [Candidatus Diapherotrites archaeon]
MRLYLDTNVWISLFKEEGMPTYFAERMFEKAVGNGDTVLLSDLVIQEMENVYPYLVPLMKSFIADTGLLVERIETTGAILKKAVELNRKIAGEIGERIGVNDAAHFLLAKKSSVGFFVSGEKIHKEVGDLIGVAVIEPGEY